MCLRRLVGSDQLHWFHQQMAVEATFPDTTAIDITVGDIW